MKIFTFNKENVTSALEQIFYYFQIKKEETKNSTSSNLSNYSSMDGNFINNGKQCRSMEVLDVNKFQMNKKSAQCIDTAFGNMGSFGNLNNFENFENFNNDHDADFFFMDR